MIYTVLGSNGFVGQALSQWLRSQGHEVHTPSRKLLPVEVSASLCGHVVYCIGLTSDFRSRPWDTIDAHVSVLRQLLADGNFTSLTYLSSTRVYLGGNSGKEDTVLTLHPEESDQLYNISKLLGESMCHTAYRPEKPVRVVRLSNVVGNNLNSNDFIYSLLREAQVTGVIELNSSLDLVKDYISLFDVTRMLELIACCGQARCYNLASGQQTSNRNVVETIVKLTGAKFGGANNGVQPAFPPIDINRLRNEFDFNPLEPLSYLEEVFNNSF